MRNFKSLSVTGALVAAMCCAAAAQGQRQDTTRQGRQNQKPSEQQGAMKGAQKGQKGHVMVNPAELKWSKAPDALPQGAQAAVLQGDPMKKGQPFTLRLRLPANYRIPAHSHPVDENVTVLSGNVRIGMGDTLNTDQGMALQQGGFTALPANQNHYLWTTQESVIQLHGMGPMEFTYVNPQDDPRQKGRQMGMRAK